MTSRPNGLVQSSSPCEGHSMEATRRRLLAKAKRKSLMITIVIVATFVICWTPYYAMMVIFIFNLDPDQRITGELSSAIFFFGMIWELVENTMLHKRPIPCLLQLNPRLVLSKYSAQYVTHQCFFLFF